MMRNPRRRVGCQTFGRLCIVTTMDILGHGGTLLLGGGLHQGRCAPTLMHDTHTDQHYRLAMPAEESGEQLLANLIKDQREALDLTQGDLAKKAKVSRPTVQRAEYGKRVQPEKLRSIFLALGLDPREIPVALGLVTRAEVGLTPEPAPRYSRVTQEMIKLFEDRAVSDEEKEAVVTLLRSRRAK